ncbi:hypothetical protein [Vibrio crassostreae]|uniref:hypothetical protein n=1 Tax=Vibrio crassostreae TaxID=246167 RepID=UPI000F48A614|nr:hypothetical protein [Vibrio crassostreae]ROS67521.1 hypothetical protein EDB73_10495 [Vibrio crassostreae]
MAKFNKDKIPLSGHYEMMSKDNHKLFKRTEQCLLGKGICSEKAIRSHSIQEASLRQIADKTSHLYSFESLSYKELIDLHNNGVYLPKKIGVSNATIFNGFCSKHDTELFLCIEKIEITPNKKQLNALCFRAMSKSYLGNKSLKEAIINILKNDYPEYHKPDKQLAYIRHQAKSQNKSLEQQSLEYITAKNKMFIPELIKENFLFFRLQSIPDIMCSTILAPIFDFEGFSLLNEGVPNDIQYLCITISSDVKGGYVILQWSKNDEITSSFISSFYNVDCDFNKLMAYIMLFTDFVFSPNWWEALPDNQKEIITHFAMAPHFISLLEDMGVPLKVYNNFLSKGINFVDWRVVECKTNA